MSDQATAGSQTNIKAINSERAKRNPIKGYQSLLVVGSASTIKKPNRASNLFHSSRLRLFSPATKSGSKKTRFECTRESVWYFRVYCLASNRHPGFRSFNESERQSIFCPVTRNSKSSCQGSLKSGVSDLAGSICRVDDSRDQSCQAG